MYIYMDIHVYTLYMYISYIYPHTYMHAYKHACIHRFEKVGDADMALFGWEDSHHDTSFAIP